MNPNKIYQSYIEAGSDWADKHGAAELLEHTLKSLRAQYTLDARHSLKCSMSESAEVALASLAYMDACKGAVDARTEANKARVRYTAVQALFEAQRTAEASERAATRGAT